jgi:predicted nuclease of predicted toxin-antitoxin system
MILADENIDRLIIESLRKIGFEVYSIKESMPGISDKSIVEFSKSPKRVILTNDKDFGNWVFAHHVQGLSVVLLRYQFQDRVKMLDIIKNFFKDHKNSLEGKFITITVNKIRTVTLH